MPPVIIIPLLVFFEHSSLRRWTQIMYDEISSHVYNMISERSWVSPCGPRSLYPCSLVQSLAISGFCGFKHACIINGSFTNSSEWRSEGERLLVEVRHTLQSLVVVLSLESPPNFINYGSGRHFSGGFCGLLVWNIMCFSFVLSRWTDEHRQTGDVNATERNPERLQSCGVFSCTSLPMSFLDPKAIPQTDRSELQGFFDRWTLERCGLSIIRMATWEDVSALDWMLSFFYPWMYLLKTICYKGWNGMQRLFKKSAGCDLNKTFPDIMFFEIRKRCTYSKLQFICQRIANKQTVWGTNRIARLT